MQCHLKSLNNPLGKRKWVRKTMVSRASRTNEIARFAIETNFRLKLNPNKTQTGEWMMTKMKNLGPAFVKLGQFFSTRNDLFGKEVAVELSKLQDNIEPENFDLILNTLNDEFSPQQMSHLIDIQPIPIASASIGQVHRAKLRSEGTIKDVVIKVQKTNIGDMIRNDIRSLKDVVGLGKYTNNRQSTEVMVVLDQYEAFISAELDFRSEMKHMQRFRKIFAQMPWVRIPRVYSNYCTEKVIIMEYVPSIKISDTQRLHDANIDTAEQCTRIVDAFIYMMTEHGYIHCDPHPGNIGVMANGEAIVLYDFGNVVQLTKDFRNSIPNLLFAIVQQDVDEFLELLIQLKIIYLPEDTDKAELKEFFTYFFRYLKTLDLNNFRMSVMSNQMLNDVNSRVSFTIDNNFLSLFRVFSLLDGTCAALDPNFNYVQAIQPFTETLVSDLTFVESRVRRDVSKIQSIPGMFRETDASIVRINRRVQMIQSSMDETRVLLMLTVLLNVVPFETNWITSIPIVLYLIYKMVRRS